VDLDQRVLWDKMHQVLLLEAPVQILEAPVQLLEVEVLHPKVRVGDLPLLLKVVVDSVHLVVILLFLALHLREVPFKVPDDDCLYFLCTQVTVNLEVFISKIEHTFTALIPGTK